MSNRPFKVGDRVQVVKVINPPQPTELVGFVTVIKRALSHFGQEVYLLEGIDEVRYRVSYFVEAVGEYCFYPDQLRHIGDPPELSSMDTLRDLGLFNDNWIPKHETA